MAPLTRLPTGRPPPQAGALSCCPREKIDAITICGTDLHILKGDVPTVDRGRILGHRVDGVQADFARIPFADTSTYVLPSGRSRSDAGQRRTRRPVFAHPQDSKALKVALFHS